MLGALDSFSHQLLNHMMLCEEVVESRTSVNSNLWRTPRYLIDSFHILALFFITIIPCEDSFFTNKE